jgi:hypothetical protein
MGHVLLLQNTWFSWQKNLNSRKKAQKAQKKRDERTYVTTYQLCQSLHLAIPLCVRGRRLLLADILRLRDEGGSVLTKITSWLPGYKSHFSVALAGQLICAQLPRAKALGYSVLPFHGRFALAGSAAKN